MKKQLFIVLTLVNISILADSWKEKFNKYNPFAKKEQNVKTQKELNAGEEDWENEFSAHDNRYSQDPLVREGQRVIDSQHSISTKELFNMIKDLQTKTSDDLAQRYNSDDLLTQKIDLKEKFNLYTQNRKNQPVNDEDLFRVKYHAKMAKRLSDAYEQRKKNEDISEKNRAKYSEINNEYNFTDDQDANWGIHI